MAGQPSDAFDAGDLHFVIDRGRADIQRASEDERKAENVVDLVRHIRAARCDDRVRGGFARVFGINLGVRVGKGKDNALQPPRAGLFST